MREIKRKQFLSGAVKHQQRWREFFLIWAVPMAISPLQIIWPCPSSITATRIAWILWATSSLPSRSDRHLVMTEGHRIIRPEWQVHSIGQGPYRQQVMVARHRVTWPGQQVMAARHRVTCPWAASHGGKTQGHVPWAASHRIMGPAALKLW